jgi:hypothetical protein
MYSPGAVSMYTQAVQADLEREIEKYQMIKAAAEGKAERETLSLQLARLYRSTLEKVSRLSNSRRNEIKVARCS